MSKETKATIEVECKLCGDVIVLSVEPQDLAEYLTPNRRHIQDIFPYLTPAERELLISSTCEKCWNKMFKDFE